MAPSPTARCRTHPGNLAGWTCEACREALCPKCVAEQMYGSTPVDTCVRCGERALALRLHRSHRPYAARLVDTGRFLVRPSTLLSLVALGIFKVLMNWFGGCIGAVLSVAATWAYVFYVLTSAAKGVELDVPDFSSVADFSRPLIRGVVSTFVLWVPAVLYLVWVKEWVPGEPAVGLIDPVLLLIVAVGIFYGPIAFMVAATDTSFLNLLNPVAMVGWVIKLGMDYVIALGAMGVGVLLHGVLSLLAGALGQVGLPAVTAVVGQTLSLVMPFAMAHALGLLLYVRGDRVGYGFEDDYYEQVLPGARPEGAVPARGQGLAPAAVSSPEPVEAAPAAGEGVQEAADGLRAVTEAVVARDAAGAVSGYRGLVPKELTQLGPEQHLFVGRAAVGGGDLALAAKAFEAAADVAPNVATAPQALVLLARLCAERMQDPERAQSVYRYIVHRYPGTEAARFATQRLE